MAELRIFITYSPAEWRCLENQISNYGFKEVRNFIHHRIRKQLPLLPQASIDNCAKKDTRSFSITDAEAINRIESYCRNNKIPPSTLVRRLATDPLVLNCLLG